MMQTRASCSSARRAPLAESFGLRIFSLLFLLLCSTLQPALGDDSDLVPELCDLRDQPMYCKCENKYIGKDDVEIICFVVRNLTEDHVVFKAFQNQPSIVSITFSTFRSDYHLHFVPTEALRSAAPSLESLKFTQANLGSLKTHSFYNLPKLKTLSLDSNDITDLGNESIADLPHLTKLEMGDNKLVKLPAHALSRLSALTHLFLERNQIKSIEDTAFADLGALKELDLSDNMIVTLTEGTFKGLDHLERLDMFRNKLQRLDARVFRGAPALVELDLKYNEVSEVDPLAFEGLPRLKKFYFSHNRLRILPANMFLGAPNLLTVDLSQNQLLTLTWRTVQDLRKIDAESFDMSLTGNKFSCDCRISWIAHLANATRNDNFRRELRHIKCDFAAADGATGTSSKVARLSAKELNCPKDHEKPKFENSHPEAEVDSTTMTTVASPHEGDILEHRDDRNQIEEEDSEEALASEARGDATATTQTMKNEIDMMLSQRKVMQKEAAHSRKDNGNSGASLVGWSITLQLFFAVATSGMTAAGILVRHS
ncbi:connectin-like [Ixodes scapularis]|uniref:connectin-like n=1 Tax=Ixodes scapularis TaxID=6945 RepID=UPI001A9CE3EE|nr:connectin-like [Ixodes scapularis]